MTGLGAVRAPRPRCDLARGRGWALALALLGVGAWLGLGPGHGTGTGSARAQTPEAALVVEPTTIGRGQRGAVVVRVEDVANLYGADVQLRFDASRMQAVDADPDAEGVQLALGDFLSPDFVIRNTVDNEAGTLHVALSQINPSEARSGSGTLFVLRLSAGETLGPTAIELVDASLGARGGERIPYRSRIGSVTIVGPDQAPATPTVGPTPVANAPIAPDIPPAAPQAPPATGAQGEDPGDVDRGASDPGGAAAESDPVRDAPSGGAGREPLSPSRGATAASAPGRPQAAATGTEEDATAADGLESGEAASSPDDGDGADDPDELAARAEAATAPLPTAAAAQAASGADQDQDQDSARAPDGDAPRRASGVLWWVALLALAVAAGIYVLRR